MSTAKTAPCAACSQPVDLTAYHHTVSREIVRLTSNDEIDVSDSEVVATMHLICAQAIGAGIGQGSVSAEAIR